MNIKLSWDLFVIVFFAIIIAYSFILGKNATLKIILGTYAGALAADAAGNLFTHYAVQSQTLVRLMTSVGFGNEKDMGIVIKVVIFIAFIILLTIKGSFTVEAHGGRTGTMRTIMTGVYGFLSAALIVSIILMYVSGISFITGSFGPGPASIMSFSGQSPFIQKMLDFYNVWFLLPVIAIIVGSFMLDSNEA